MTQLDRIEALLKLIVQQSPKDYYSTEEFAARVGLAPYTIREHCRRSRLRAVKRRSGRGRFGAWALPHTELVRYQREGLLPSDKCDNGCRINLEVTP